MGRTRFRRKDILKKLTEIFGDVSRNVLETRQQAVIDKFPLSNELFSATTPRLLPGGDDGLGFHCLIIQAKMIIK